MFEVQVIGATRVRTGGHVLRGRDFGGAKPRQLLEMLALQAGAPLSKERLAELLWEGDPPASWRATLEGYVSLLRGRLQPGTAARASVVRTVQGGYLLDEQVHVDVRAVRDLVAQATEARPAAALGLLRRALTAGQGELLAETGSAGWAVAARHGFERLLRDAGTRAAGAALHLGQPDLAVTLADEVLERDPLAEEACRCAMRGLWSTGRTAEALRRHAALRGVLADELGVDPSPATQAMMTALLRDEPAPVVPAQRRCTDLPPAVAGLPLRRVDLLTGALVAALRRPAAGAPDEDPRLIALLEQALRHLEGGAEEERAALRAV